VATQMRAAKEFQMPVLVTEQYPERLGATGKPLDLSHTH